MRTIIQSNNSEVKSVNYFCIIDLSGSMDPHIDDLKKSIMMINEWVKENDTISIGYFSGYEEYEWICKGSRIKEINLQKLLDQKIKSIGLTCYSQILKDTVKVIEDVKLMTGNEQTSVFFLTDGYPNDHYKYDEVIKLCKQINAFILYCGFGQYYNRDLLLSMSKESNGQMIHIEKIESMKNMYNQLFGQKRMISMKLDRRYEYVWQIIDSDIYILNQNEDLSVDIYESEHTSKLFGYSHSDSIEESDSQFIYSLVYVLSMKGQVNQAVLILKNLNALQDAKLLRKAFTISQKGQIENVFKQKAIEAQPLIKSVETPSINLYDFISDIYENRGKYNLDLKNSIYKKISRKTNYDSKIKFEKISEPMITNIISNENKANLSLQTVTECLIHEVDDELKNKIDLFNQKSDKKIEFPIRTKMIKNYTLIANGEFNFDKLTINGKTIIPSEEIDIIDETTKTLEINMFTNLSKQLIEYKAHQSVINMYLKKYQDEKEDLRVNEYGQEGATLLSEIGIDSKFRFTQKKLKTEKSKDFIPFTSIETCLKGAATINAKKYYEKYVSGNKKKLNPGDQITFPLFDKYEKMLISIDKNEFIQLLLNDSKSIEKNICLLKGKISNIKFYMIITNSWFDDVVKSDKFEHDGLVIKLKEEKVFL